MRARVEEFIGASRTLTASQKPRETAQRGTADMGSLPQVPSEQYRGLNNYLCYIGGFLTIIIIIVSWAPKPYSKC